MPDQVRYDEFIRCDRNLFYTTQGEDNVLRLSIIAAGLLGVMATFPSSAVASSCVNSRTVSIQFQRGARCWVYQGDATHVTGDFRAGQTVIASSTGIANLGDGDWEWQTTSVRNLTVEGPGRSSVEATEDESSGSDEMTFRVPQTGRYTFSFFPCSMWRAPGTFVICAR